MKIAISLQLTWWKINCRKTLHWRTNISLVVLCFTPKQVFGPRTAKSQPIWIKFCKHLLLYGIHLWADLDRDRRVGGSRPNQNDYVFVILVTHPKYYIETTDRRNFGGKPSKWRWGRVLSWKIPEFCSVGGARSKNSIFLVFRVPFDYLAHSLKETILPPNQWYWWKTESLKVCLLLVWRVYSQAFGIYRPWTVSQSAHVTITKIENLHMYTLAKIHWFQKCYFFDLRRKITTLSRKNRFRTVASPGAWPS